MLLIIFVLLWSEIRYDERMTSIILSLDDPMAQVYNKNTLEIMSS